MVLFVRKIVIDNEAKLIPFDINVSIGNRFRQAILLIQQAIQDKTPSFAQYLHLPHSQALSTKSLCGFFVKYEQQSYYTLLNPMQLKVTQ